MRTSGRRRSTNIHDYRDVRTPPRSVFPDLDYQRAVLGVREEHERRQREKKNDPETKRRREVILKEIPNGWQSGTRPRYDTPESKKTRKKKS